MSGKHINFISPQKKGKWNFSLNLRTDSHKSYRINHQDIERKKGAPGSICLSAPASFTVEAAFVLPIVLMVCVSMLFFFRIIAVESAVQSALNYAARECAVYAGELAWMAEGAEKEESGSLSEAALLVKARMLVIQKLKGYSYPYSLLQQPGKELVFPGSDASGDEIALCVTYKMKLPVTFFGKRTFQISQQSTARKWTGAVKDGQGGDGTGSTWVYITPAGSAYHKTDMCSYLKLSVREVSIAQAEALRNKDGGKYYPCSRCKKGDKSTVYITDYGVNYHFSLDCSGLKRTIYHVKLDTISGYHPCGKCYGG